MRRPEILAPGGSVESIYSAINAGCDAIYMGGKRYGARAFADNPDNDGLLKIIDDIHVSGKKIYLTVNTVLTENDMKNLYDYIRPVYEAGVDAVIVQDFGVMKFLHMEFPELDIHASTQMSIVSAEAANLLKKYGVNRVVPARELSFDELNLMRKNTDSEIEVFVHGALCCSYSGQCLMSSMIGGRSGNKGACAQPCRKSYTFNDGRRAHMLSLKDLCTLQYIPELVNAGVDSYKIEGRMKKPEYVAVTTHMYRKYLDYYYELGDEGYRDYIITSSEYQKDMIKLKDIYNRGGFTVGYLINSVKRDEMMSENRPNHEGVIVGDVESVNSKLGQATIRFTKDVYPQDILEIRSKNVVVHEHTLKNGISNKMSEVINTGFNADKIFKGNKVYRIRNNALISELTSKYPPFMPKIGVSGTFTAREGNCTELSVWLTNDSNVYTVLYGNVVSAATKHAADEEDVRSKVMVSGESCFSWDKLDISMDDNLFLSAGELKRLRRDALANLYETIVSMYRRISEEYVPYEVGHSSYMKEWIAECRNVQQFNTVNCIDDIDTIYLHIEDMDMDVIENILKQSTKCVYPVMPRLFRTEVKNAFESRYDIKKIISYECVKGFVVCNIEQIAWFNECGFNDSVKMRTADNLYVRNSMAYDCYTELGASGCMASHEMLDRELEAISKYNVDIPIYGRPTVMIMANRFNENGNLKDSYGNDYVVIDHEFTNYCEILHYEPIDRIDSGLNIESDRIRFIFTIEDDRTIRKVIDRFRRKTKG